MITAVGHTASGLRVQLSYDKDDHTQVLFIEDGHVHDIEINAFNDLINETHFNLKAEQKKERFWNFVNKYLPTCLSSLFGCLLSYVYLRWKQN